MLLHTLAEEVDASLWAERVLAWLSTPFDVVAAVLAAISVYATLACDRFVLSITAGVGF